MKRKETKAKPKDPLQLEIAAELGLAEKIEKLGWGSLTSAESGRIGGLLRARKRKDEQTRRV